jgi:hypothetical protein
MVEYFQALLDNRAVMPANKQSVKSLIIQRNQLQISNMTKGNDFKDRESSTIVGKIAKKRQSIAGNDAQEIEYHNIGNAFYKDKKKVKIVKSLSV